MKFQKCFTKKRGHTIFGLKDFPANFWNLSENIYYTLYVICKQTYGIWNGITLKGLCCIWKLLIYSF